MSQEGPVRRIESPDGTRFVEFTSRSDGLFSFEEVSLVTEDGYTLWTPTHCSGLHDTLASAEREARATLPWLRDQISN